MRCCSCIVLTLAVEMAKDNMGMGREIEKACNQKLKMTTTDRSQLSHVYFHLTKVWSSSYQDREGYLTEKFAGCNLRPSFFLVSHDDLHCIRSVPDTGFILGGSTSSTVTSLANLLPFHNMGNCTILF